MKIVRPGHRYIDAETGMTLDAWFPTSQQKCVRRCLAEKHGFARGEIIEEVVYAFDEPPKCTEAAYLRLHLLSERAVAPNQVNLDNIFELLPIVAWTSAGPVHPAKVEALRAAVASDWHHLTVGSVDRFPRMTDYIVPSGVRVANADRVRLGAHLANGTTVMHEGFVNFNAGTLGDSMVEGRITAGVVVGENSDVGAGSSIMGTLSGGGKRKNSIGKRSLLGANAGIGISLGDDCIVEAGLYVTAGTKVRTPDGQVVAARQLSGQHGLLFRRNSQTGVVEVLPTKERQWSGLNTSLHSND